MLDSITSSQLLSLFLHSATHRRRNEFWSGGIGEARPEGPRVGVGFLGRGPASPLPTSYGVWGSAVSSPSGVRRGAPAAEGFSSILCQDYLLQHLSRCCMQSALVGIRGVRTEI